MIVRLIPIILLCFSLQVKAVDYVLPDLDGNPQSLDQYLGKWVVVNFWATWCGTCHEELPDLVQLHESNKHRRIVVIGINFEDTSDEHVKSFVKTHGISFPVWRSKVVKETPLGIVPALPTTYIINPSGEVVAGQVGVITREEIEAYIRSKESGVEKPTG